MMDVNGIVAILGLAFGLGLLHALDADHVMAVSGLASTRPSRRDALRFCAHWAVGHGLTLMGFGAAVLLLGVALPEHLSETAERLVGVVLVAIGLWVLWDLVRSRAHLHFHAHDGLREHAHWHTHNRDEQREHHRASHRHGHGAVMVGVLHGTAGSAPLLALIPVATSGSAWLGMAYLLVFGVGVLVSMLVFGGLIGALFNWLASYGNRVVPLLRGGVALGSIGFGVFWLHGGL